MPQVFKVGSNWVFFWANENDSLEPVHVNGPTFSEKLDSSAENHLSERHSTTTVLCLLA